MSVEEQMQMKVLDDLGYNKTEICEATGRGYKAVKKGLTDFEVLLVGNEDLYEKFEEERDKFLERMVQNSAMLVVAADHVVAQKLPDSSAIEAAKISQIYANRLDGITNLSAKGLDGSIGNKNQVVINYINKVFNIANNDRPKEISRVEGGPDGDEGGGQAPSDAGAV